MMAGSELEAADPLAALWDAVEADRAEAVDRAVRVALPGLLQRGRAQGPAIVDAIIANPKRAHAVKGAVRKTWIDLGLGEATL